MDELIINVITNLPNFAVAFIVLYWQKREIDSLLETQRWLIEQLMSKQQWEDDEDGQGI